MLEFLLGFVVGFTVWGFILGWFIIPRDRIRLAIRALRGEFTEEMTKCDEKKEQSPVSLVKSSSIQSKQMIASIPETSSDRKEKEPPVVLKPKKKEEEAPKQEKPEIIQRMPEFHFENHETSPQAIHETLHQEIQETLQQKSQVPKKEPEANEFEEALKSIQANEEEDAEKFLLTMPGESDPLAQNASQTSHASPIKLLTSSNTHSPKKIPLIRDSNCQPIISRAIQDLLETIEAGEEHGWKKPFQKKDLILSKKDPRTGTLHSFKSSGEVDASVDSILSLLIDPSRADQWDSFQTEVKLIQELGPNTRVLQRIYHTEKCIIKTPRDFCLLDHYQRMDDGSVVLINRSISHSKCPSQANCVRAELLPSGFLLKGYENSPNKAFVTYVCQVDLKGIPSGVIELISEKQLMVIESIRLALQGMNQSKQESKSNSEVEPNKSTEISKQNQEMEEPGKDTNQIVPEKQEPNISDHTIPGEIKERDLLQGVDDPQLRSAIEETVHLMLQYAEAKDWEFVEKTHGIEVTKKNMEKFVASRGRGEIAVPVDILSAYISKLEYRGEWDSMFKEGDQLLSYNEQTRLIRLAFHPVWPTTARDFCNIFHRREMLDGRIVLAAKSVVDPLCPEKKGYVRAFLHFGGFILEPLEENKTRVIYLQKVDLKGTLPNSIVNAVTVKQPLAIDGIRKALGKRNNIF